MSKSVPIEIDNKTRNLRYDMNAISDLEDRIKTSIFSLLGSERIGFGSTRQLLWAGLRHEDKGLTLEKAGDILQRYIEAGNRLADISSLIVRALELAGVLAAAGVEDEPDSEGNGQTGAAN